MRRGLPPLAADDEVLAYCVAINDDVIQYAYLDRTHWLERYRLRPSIRQTVPNARALVERANAIYSTTETGYQYAFSAKGFSHIAQIRVRGPAVRVCESYPYHDLHWHYAVARSSTTFCMYKEHGEMK